MRQISDVTSVTYPIEQREIYISNTVHWNAYACEEVTDIPLIHTALCWIICGTKYIEAIQHLYTDHIF